MSEPPPTASTAAKAIANEGFRTDLKENMGRIWGDGTYLGIGPGTSESAEYYKQWFADPATLTEAMARLSRALA